jgi:hypothetical protein
MLFTHCRAYQVQWRGKFTLRGNWSWRTTDLQAMKAKTTALAILLASSLFASSEEAQLGFDLLAPVQSSTAWRYDRAVWEQLSVWEPSFRLSLASREFVVSGALADTFRRPRQWPDLSLGEKILNFPVLNLFIPAKLPQASARGKFFVWGERNESWTTLAGGGAGGSAGVLLSVGW